MAYKLTKQEELERAKLIKDAREAHTGLEIVIQAANAKIDALKDEVKTALARYNEELIKIDAWREDIVNVHQSTYDESSESWQAGDRGSAVSLWIDEWTALDFDEIDLDLPEAIDTPSDDVLFDFENTNSEPMY